MRQASLIKIANLNKRFNIDELLLRTVIRDILRRLKFKREEFEFIFLDRRRIRNLNRNFKRIDAPTDVLAFRLEEEKGLSRRAYVSIFISLDAALENSKVFNNPFEREVVLYIIHGLLHIAGYDDKSSQERVRMRTRQEKVLEEICANRDLSRVLTLA